jgi:hypothetical protein
MVEEPPNGLGRHRQRLLLHALNDPRAVPTTNSISIALARSAVGNLPWATREGGYTGPTHASRPPRKPVRFISMSAGTHTRRGVGHDRTPQSG